jgi:hypothetical protein
MTTNSLRAELAPRILPVLLANIMTRYPYHDAHLMQEGERPVDPTAAHPAFGNSFDWHSSVHSHWTALQVADYITNTSGAANEDVTRLRRGIEANLTPAHLAIETEYLRTHPSYERPYGWAWALALAALTEASEDVHTRTLRTPLRAMAEAIAAEAVRWLSVLSEPVRHGVHSNTAFAMSLIHDAASILGFGDLKRTVSDRSRAWFSEDRGWPIQWERSGNDFLSPGLAEAHLMRRVLPPGEFAAWWHGFLPQASQDALAFAPVAVPDVADGHIVHLHGLNLSRAGMLARIASALHSANEPGRHVNGLLSNARTLYNSGVEHAVSGDYLSTHWLATYAWIAACALDAAQDSECASEASRLR